MNKLKDSNENIIINGNVNVNIKIVQGKEEKSNSSETNKADFSENKNEISLNIYTDELASKNSDWINDLSKGSSSSKMLEYIFDKFKEKIDQSNNKEGDKFKDVVSEAVDHAFATYLLENEKKGSLIMADSIASSFEYKTDRDYLNSIKEVIPEAQSKYFVFLSAITKKKNSKENTLEYKVALKLKDYFEKKGIGVFWWEDKNIKSHNWNISTKIAMGLGFSTVFIGLAFDSISEDEKGSYIYNCFFDDDEKAYKTPNFFKYEVDKFSLLFNKKEAKKFFKGIISTKTDFSKFVPKKRFLRFFTFGSPRDFMPYSSFNDKEDRWISIDKPSSSSEEEKIQAIFNNIVQNLEDLPFQNFKNNKYDDLYKPFDILSINDQYTDDFLKNKALPSLNENYQMIPSDYFFEYLIIDDNGKNAKNHFLIFPEKEYTVAGNITWNIKLIVKDWNYEKIFNEQSLLKNYNNIVITNDFESNDGLSYSRKIYDESKSCACDLCKDVFTSSRGKMKGKIILKSESEKLEEKEFYYSINFIPKKIIRYQTKNRRIKLLDKPNSPLKIKVAFPSTDNVISCLNNTRLSDEEYILKNNLKVSKLKKGCRLRLEKTENNKYIVLKSMDNQTLDMTKPLKSSVQRCVFCGNIVSKKNKNSCIGVSKGEKTPKCKHNYIYDVFDFSGNAQTGQNQIEAKEIKLNTNDSGKEEIYACEKNQLPPSPTENSEMCLPENFRNGVVVSFVGESKTGKSTFISSLFGVSDNRIHDEIISNSLHPYVSETSFYYDNVPENYTENISRYILQHDYTAFKYGDFIKPTTNVRGMESIARAHIPFILKLKGIQNSGEEAYLSFFDAPGGMMCEKIDDNIKPYNTPFSDKNEDYVMLFKSDSIILIVNGTPNPNEHQQNELNVGGVTEILHSIEHYLGKNKKEFYEKTILAVVICKFDEFAKDFDENSYIRMTAPIAYTRIFKNSERHKYIEMCSKEIKSYLNSFSQTSELLKAIDKYKHHCFFATSSIGRTDSVIRKIDVDTDTNTKKDTTQSIFFTTPYNIENILLWIMYQKGIIL